MSCANQLNGLPISCIKGNNKVALKGMILTTEDFQFDTIADAVSNTNWVNGVIAKTVFPVLDAREVDDMSGEDARYESNTQEKIELFEGKVGLMMKFHLTEEAHAVLRTYAGKNLRAFLYDLNSNIWCTSPDGAVIRGFKLGFIDVPKRGIATADTPYFSSLEIQIENTSEMEDSGYVLQTYLGTPANRWYPYNLESLTKVTVEQVGTVSANSATFDVYYGSSRTINVDGTPSTIKGIDGLDTDTPANNFIFTDGSSAVSPNTVTFDGNQSDGKSRYTAAFTTFTSGTAQIKASASNLYESDSTALS